MEILENIETWRETFEKGWLAHLKATGEVDWKRYSHPRNSEAPAGEGVRLASSRLVLITSSGAYLKGSQEPFDTQDPLGDYGVRRLPADVEAADLGYTHGHYDESFIRADMQTGIPSGHLHRMVEEGRIGELAPSIISFMGYQPDSARSVVEFVPKLLQIAKEERAGAALFAPL